MEIADEDRAMAAATATATEGSAWPGPSRRRRLLEFLLHASKVHGFPFLPPLPIEPSRLNLTSPHLPPSAIYYQRLDLRPVVKYTALSFFADRLLPSLPRKMGFCGARGGRAVTSWLLEPLRDSNLELFALVAVWIASKIHELKPLSVKSLKALGDRIIADQHFTCRDFANAELVFMEVVEYNIGSLNIAFIYLEELLVQFREISKLGDLLNMDVCMEIMDILYETEDSSWLFNSPCQLAASALVTAYVISVPKQRWEFPILPWVTFTTPYDEEDILKVALTILMHVLKPGEVKDKRDFNV
uniref:Cyclin N-terminal domain-containing protein n=1 Tax=Leersia perrieri TaxID=77586 RepID=A0A0D9VRP4_9ORYZ